MKGKNILKSIGTQKLVAIVALIVLTAFFAIASPNFRTVQTFISILDASYYIGFMAIGVTFVIITGGIDLSIGTVMVCSSLIAGTLYLKAGVPLAVCLIIGILVGAFFGAINGFMVSVMELPAFIATLGTMMVTRGLGSIVTNTESVTYPLRTSPDGWYKSIFRTGSTEMFPAGIPTGFILLIVCAIIMAIFLNKTRPGRYILSLGSNKEATRLSGVNVKKWESLAYIISGTLAGIAGVSYVAIYSTLQPGTGNGFELDAIAGVVIGGTSLSGGVGSIAGTLIGVFIMSVLKTGLPFIGLQPHYQLFITGFVLVFAVYADVVNRNQKSILGGLGMKKAKKMVALGLGLTLIGSTFLTGCGGGAKQETPPAETPPAQEAGEGTDTSDAPTEGESLSVEIVAKGFQHDFWKAVKLGAERAGEEFNTTIQFVGPNSESDIADQVQMLSNAVNKNPSAIAFAALDTSASIDVIAQAQSAGIPIVGFDSGVPGAPEGAIVANAATDNYAAGSLAAENMYEAIKDTVDAAGDTVRIGVVSQDAVSQSISDRTSGFIDKMVELIGADVASVEGHDKYNKKVDGAKVILDVGIPAQTTDAAGTTVAQTLLNKGDMIAIYGSNEFAAKSIINANEGLNALGADKILAVGFDSGALQLDAVKSGVFYGSVTQDPVSIGYNAVKLAVASARGEAVADVDTGAQWYTADNMEDPDIAPCLYE